MTKVIVTLSSRDLNTLHDELYQLKDEWNHYDIIEFRGDFFSDDEDIIEALHGLSEFGKKVLYTYRTKDEGGYGDSNQYDAHLRYIFEHAPFDMIDVEFLTYRDRSLIVELKSKGIEVVFSHHDFNGMPNVSEIENIIKQMHNEFADYSKIAYMANDNRDVELMLEVLKRSKENYGEMMIVIAMGDVGKITRVAKYPYNSAFTYGCLNKPQAPGQVPVKILSEVYSE